MDGAITQKVHFIENAGVATTYPNGYNVGTIKVYYQDGTSDSLDLIIGENIAEWSYDRPELQSSLAHNKITPAYSWATRMSSSYTYMGHLFYVSIDAQEKPIDRIELINSDGVYIGIDSITIDKQVSSNQPPVANAGTDQTVTVGTQVTLDGTSSSDPDNNLPLTYVWSMSAPSGSTATLSSITAADPTFTPDKAGDYVITLTVTDSLDLQSTAADSVTIKVTDQPPDASFMCSPDIKFINDKIVCTPNIVDKNGKYTYLWSVDGETISGFSIRKMTTTFPTIGYHKVRLTVSDATDPTLTAMTEQDIIIECGGQKSEIKTKDLIIGKVGTDGCLAQPYVSESGEEIEICWVAADNQYVATYTGPICSVPMKIGSCDFEMGSNVKTYTYIENSRKDLNKNGNNDPECFMYTTWTSKDFGYDDNKDKLLDEHVYYFYINTKLDNSYTCYRAPVVEQKYQYNCKYSVGGVFITWDKATFDNACYYTNAKGKRVLKDDPQCTTKAICSKPEGRRVL